MATGNLGSPSREENKMKVEAARHRFWQFVRLAVPLIVIAASAAYAQDAGTTADLPGVDTAGLTSTQKASASKILTGHDCSCGCGMKIAECRVKDPSCSYSKGLASVIVDALKKGQTESQAIAAAAASQYSHPPSDSTKILEAPVAINISGEPVRGPADARITLVEFSDFQCPYCVAAVPELQAIMKAFPTQVKLIFKQYPLETHSHAAFAAKAALAAHKQQKFWEMHDALFADHGDLSPASIERIARNLGLNMARFDADLQSPAIEQEINSDIAQGDQAGVGGTPTLFINGQRFNGPIQLQALKPLLDAELKQLKPKPDTTTASVSRRPGE
jgi:protein-disulfide isomerase